MTPSCSPENRPRSLSLEEKLVELHEALQDAGIPHAFGGCDRPCLPDPQPPRHKRHRRQPLRPGGRLVRRARGPSRWNSNNPPGTEEQLARDGQIRLWWEGTPVDLFFDYDPIHAEAARNRKLVPFSGTEIPVLGPVELVVFKAMFDRTRDWADIEEVARAGTLDVDAVRDALSRMLDPDDHRFERLDEAIRLGTERDT